LLSARSDSFILIGYSSHVGLAVDLGHFISERARFVSSIAPVLWVVVDRGHIDTKSSGSILMVATAQPPRTASHADDFDPIIDAEVPPNRCFSYIGLCVCEAGDRTSVFGRDTHYDSSIRSGAIRQIWRDRNRADKD